FANAAQSTGFILLHELAAFEGIFASGFGTEFNVIPHLRLAGLGIDAEVIEGAVPRVDRTGQGTSPAEPVERNGSGKRGLVLGAINELVEIADGNRHLETRGDGGCRLGRGRVK